MGVRYSRERGHGQQTRGAGWPMGSGMRIVLTPGHKKGAPLSGPRLLPHQRSWGETLPLAGQALSAAAAVLQVARQVL